MCNEYVLANMLRDLFIHPNTTLGQRGGAGEVKFSSPD